MTVRMLVFGMGYSAARVAAILARRGWHVVGTGRTARAGIVAFSDTARILDEIARATHILHSVPPADSGDPVLAAYGAATEQAHWVGYLSSTGVYGDAGGGWVDEATPVGGRRTARADADAAWIARGARVFRLPGIYGPGRSALDRVGEGRAHRIDLPGQVFSRVHVDDIANGVVAGLLAPPGAYNLADDRPCSQNDVVEFACRLLGRAPPPLMTIDEAGLSSMSRGFYAENRRVANGKAKRVLGWRPLYPDYRAGLRALSAMTSPVIASEAPAAGSNDQR